MKRHLQFSLYVSYAHFALYLYPLWEIEFYSLAMSSWELQYGCVVFI